MDLEELRAGFDDLVENLFAEVAKLRHELAIVTAQRDELRNRPIIVQPEPHVATSGLKEQEREQIIAALKACGGVQKDAANLLDVTPRTLNYKLRTFGLLTRFSTKSRVEEATLPKAEPVPEPVFVEVAAVEPQPQKRRVFRGRRKRTVVCRCGHAFERQHQEKLCPACWEQLNLERGARLTVARRAKHKVGEFMDPAAVR